MTIKRVSELEGQELRKAVALALGWELRKFSDDNELAWMQKHGEFEDGEPDYQWYCWESNLPAWDTDWSDGGPLMEHERITIKAQADKWTGCRYDHLKHGGFVYNGPTALIAAMRAFVASKLGTEVEL